MSKVLYVVAVDGSEWGNRAADRAINLAEKIDASVKLITVVDWSYLQQPMIMEGGVNLPALDKATEEKNITGSVLTPLLEKYKRIVDMLLGSVANKLAHTVGIPIVLVP